MSAANIPHYHGHRDRLRGRFLDNGGEVLQDYELLELLLFTCIPRKDVKPIAKDLITRFGGLAGVFSAPHEDLTEVDGVSDNTATALKAMHSVFLRTSKQQLMKRPLLQNWTQLMDYCYAAMAHENREQFRILFLNKKNELIADEVQAQGTIDHVSAYAREIVKRALELGASALILLHNHPSGDPTPSNADIEMTSAIVRASSALDITIHDHVIIARNGYTSFKNEGLI